MKVIPIPTAQPDELPYQLDFLRFINCTIYQDRTGKCYAVPPVSRDLPKEFVTLETNGIPSDWKPVSPSKAATGAAF